MTTVTVSLTEIHLVNTENKTDDLLNSIYVYGTRHNWVIIDLLGHVQNKGITNLDM